MICVLVSMLQGVDLENMSPIKKAGNLASMCTLLLCVTACPVRKPETGISRL